VRGCSKSGCDEGADVTVKLRYEPRDVEVVDLTSERGPHLLELCGGHADSLSPPVGWRISDRRAGSVAATAD